MNHRIVALVTALFLAAVMSGCAASVEAPKSAQDQSAQIAGLTAQVAELQQLVAAQQGGAGNPQSVPIEEMTPPPANFTPMGPPQNWAWTDARPVGCPDSLALKVQNNTDYFLDLLIDGIGVVNRGAMGRLPYIAPRSTAWLCLDRTGEHYVAGQRIINRMGVPVADAKFHFSIPFSGDSTMYHLLEMTTSNTSLNMP